MQYGGESDKEGHSFVCDGYDGNGFFHINWGWDGKSDNYFSLSVLNPYNNTSVGASSSSIGFCMNQMANIGVKPAPEGYTPEKVIPESYLWEHDPINVFSADSVYFQYVFMSYSYDEILVDFALGTREADGTFSFKPMGAGTVLLMLALGDGSFLDDCIVTVADSISSSIMSPIYRQTTITSTDRQTVAPYIDLQGRHLQGLPPRKGIYIRKGRKVIFRNP